MKNVLITGGAGFIGSKLSLVLKELGFNVTVIDNLSKQIHGDDPKTTSPLYKSIRGKVNFINESILNSKALSDALTKHDVIVHLAAETGTGQSMYEVEKYTNVNVSGTAKILQLLSDGRNSVKRFIVASSRAVYGEGQYMCSTHGKVYPNLRKEEYLRKGEFECRCPFCNSVLIPMHTEEDARTNPTSIYGVTKLTQEQSVHIFCSAIGIDSIAYRFQNVYGPGQSLSNPYTGILSIFSTQLKNGNRIKIFEDGEESRDFVFIDDVVNALVSGITLNGRVNEIVNVGSGEQTSVLDVAQSLIKLYDAPKDSFELTKGYRLGDIRHNYASLDKMKKILGCSPKIEFDKGVKLFSEWVNNQEIPVDEFNESLGIMKDKGLYNEVSGK